MIKIMNYVVVYNDHNSNITQLTHSPISTDNPTPSIIDAPVRTKTPLPTHTPPTRYIMSNIIENESMDEITPDQKQQNF